MTALNTFSPLVIASTNTFVINNDYTIKVENRIKKEKKSSKFNSKEADNFVNRGQVSNRLYEDICRITEGNPFLRLVFVSKGIETNQWIRFAIYYMTDSLASIISFADEESRELVNAITMMAGFGKVYDSDGVANIDDYDSTQINSEYTGRFLLNKPELVDFLSTPQFQSIMARRKFRMNEEIVDSPIMITVEESELRYVDDRKNSMANPAFAILEADDEEIVQPSFTVNEANSFSPLEFNVKPQVMPKKGEGVDGHTYTRFEALIGKYIPETINYHYENINGVYHLFITRPDTGAEEMYIIDNGSIVGGNTVAILASYISPDGFERYRFVDVLAHPAILSKVLNRAIFNYLTPQELEDVRGDYLYDYRIYNNIDFHNTSFFDDLKPEEKYDFESSLLAVMSSIDLAGYGNVRFRFGSYNNSRSFTLISDYNMYRPLTFIQDKMMPETGVIEGMEIVVSPDHVYIKLNNELIGSYRIG